MIAHFVEPLVNAAASQLAERAFEDYPAVLQGAVPGLVGDQKMPFAEIAQGRMSPPQGKPVLLVCAVGGRSLALGRAMIEYGWKEVYNLEGGISNWKQQGFPVVRYSQ